MQIEDLILNFCKTKPKADVIIGYGSGVKKQANDIGLPKQIDLIMGVDNPLDWHRQNYELNPNDYFSNIGFKLLPIYQNIGTRVNYLAYLPYDQYMFKIGVISTQDLLDDLLNWKNFYLAGRLQKPVQIIKSTSQLDNNITLNRLNALKIALLLNNRQISTESELFQALCSLSFIGDWRRIFQIENPHKIENIVNGSFSEMQEIYQPLNNGYYINCQHGKIIINHAKIIKELDTLPKKLETKIRAKITSSDIDTEQLIEIRKTILKYFENINLLTSAAQPIKGIMTNGVSKSNSYLKQKIAKKQVN